MTFLNFGEILFDVFKDYRKLGGAPLNVAAHLSKLGGKGYIISAIGNDEMGIEALSAIQSFGLDPSYIKHSKYETGRADIILKGKNADYTFTSPCAWDDITVERPLPKEVDAIYFGTLAQRSNTSKSTLDDVLATVKAKHMFFDVNIRKNFYTDEILKQGIERSTILKLNDEECPIILKALDFDSIDTLLKKTNLQMVLMTKGKEGTELHTLGKIFNQGCIDVKVVDTVGAGDSLSAGFLYTLISTGDIEKALKIGSLLADYVVSQEGAIPQYDEKLKENLKRILEL